MQRRTGISNRESATDEAREREEHPPFDTNSPPPEDAAGRVGEQPLDDRRDRHTSHKAGSRSIAQKEAASRYPDRSMPASRKVPGAFGKEPNGPSRNVSKGKTMANPTPERRTPEGMNEAQILNLLERLGQALSNGDSAAAASCFDIPALMLSHEGSFEFSTTKGIEGLIKQAVQSYRSQGIVATRPELQRIEALTERIAAVDVRWPGFDEAGAEKSTERSHYILQLAQEGQPRIRVALTRTTGE